jgi:hypothetical protein
MSENSQNSEYSGIMRTSQGYSDSILLRSDTKRVIGSLEIIHEENYGNSDINMEIGGGNQFNVGLFCICLQ